MITEKMEAEINSKKGLTKTLQKKLDTLCELELKIANATNKILIDPNIGDKIEGRITDKAKIALVEKSLENEKTKLAWLENDIVKIKQDIGLADDKIRLYKYMIREKELSV